MMNDINFEIKIEGDSEGYITFECPFCESEFKLQAGEIQDEENVYTELYCPYCGLVDKVNSFFTKEVVEKIQTIAQNYLIEELNKYFNKTKKSLNSKYVKLEYKELKKVNIKELKVNDSVEEVFDCPMCNNHVRVLYCSGVSKVFCSYCGVDL